jgi:acetolactate synthase I/II/III large subunit
MNTRRAANVLVDQFRIHGVERIFCVPGESYLDVLDALVDAPSIQLISARQEGGAAFMAEAYGKLTGKPGICFVTRGPGASNASIGVHTAFHDCTPLILFVGQVARPFLEREAFQEIDYRQMFGSISKWVTQIDDPARLPELLARAFALAVSGRPGPVVIALPEDMLAEQIAVPDAAPYRRTQGSPSHTQTAELRALLQNAERPLVIVGGGDWSTEAAYDARAFVQANNLPVLASFRAQDVIDNVLPQYIGALGLGGDLALRERIKQADVLLVLGDRLSELPMDDYMLLRAPTPAQTLIHVFPDPDELGHVYQPALAIASGMPECAAALRALAPLDSTAWATWRTEARAAYEAHTRAVPTGAALDLPLVFAQLAHALPVDAIITNGAGNYTAFVHRYLPFAHYRSQVAPVNGTMGYGVPAAVACKLSAPERTVVAFAGDGCFLMNGQELSTAIQYDARILIIVMNNGSLGTIRTHQDRRFPGRVSGTDLINPDFAAYARAFGAHGETVTRTADFAPALARALAAPTAALIELRY